MCTLTFSLIFFSQTLLFPTVRPRAILPTAKAPPDDPLKRSENVLFKRPVDDPLHFPIKHEDSPKPSDPDPRLQGLPAPVVDQVKNDKEIDDLLPPDHIDAVRLEQDGDLNQDFHKEVFLGNHEDLESRGANETDKLLAVIFDKVDADSDGALTEQELDDWISVKIKEHIDEAIRENKEKFETLDSDKDGYVSWKDYLKNFLVERKFPSELAERHTDDYETLNLPDDLKDKIARFRFRWSEADEEPQDNRLTESEFLAFMHPEHSVKMLQMWVTDIMRGLDADGDNEITEAEFAALPEGQVDEQWEETDRNWQAQRRREFVDAIDLNGDGKVTKDELTLYVDPKNSKHAKDEAHNLIELVDADRDDKLSLSELLARKDIILFSKMVDTGRSLHDEF